LTRRFPARPKGSGYPGRVDDAARLIFWKRWNGCTVFSPQTPMGTVWLCSTWLRMPRPLLALPSKKHAGRA